MYGNDPIPLKPLTQGGGGCVSILMKGGETMTFSEWFDEFFETYCDGVLSYDCAVEYKIINEKHYRPIANMELENIKPIHIQRCLNTAKNYGSSRQRKVYFLLKRCLNEAVLNEYASKNAAEKIKAPKKIIKNFIPLTKTQLKQLFEEETPDILMFKLELWTGLRRGEILALKWENINFDEGYINVCQTLVNSKGHAIIRNSTKSNKDRRVPLCNESRRILAAVQNADKSKKGYVFHNEKGEPLSFTVYHTHYKKFFKERQEKYPNIPYISPHKLRHTYATYILQSGGDIETLRCMLGHSNISTTAIYVHSSFEQMKAAANRLNFD